MKKVIGLSIVAGSLLMGGGYRVPEQSLNSMALCAAYVANTSGADTAYANPANMAFMEDDKSYFDGALTLVHLPSNVYTSVLPPLSGESEVENIVLPAGHYVAPAMGNFRWGISLMAPGGLRKRWETPYQKATTEEFFLRIVELNPSFSYKVSDTFSVGGGIRLIYSDGVVKADASPFLGPIMDMEGDALEVGYNLALAYRPTDDIKMGATYRSNIDIKEEGTADIIPIYSGPASVTLPLPAALNLAVSKTWNDLTVELNYERVYWSSFKELEFEGTPLPVATKNWKDSNVYRIGVTYQVDEKLTAMAGFAIDQTPIPDEHVGFELPDSDSKVYSMGFRYQQDEHFSWGIAVLYDDKESRTVAAGVVDPVGGEFTEGGAFLATIGMAYEF
jgi:long-chain fatty acid transport protein